MIELIIFGAGGHARECAEIAYQAGIARGDLSFCVDDAFQIQDELSGVRVISFSEFASQRRKPPVVIGVGSPPDRKALAERLTAIGCEFAPLVSPAAVVASSAKIGAGVVLFPGCVISTDTELGPHCHVNSLSNVSHDSVIGAFTTVAPGALICGRVVVGPGCWIGAGATVLNGAPGSPLRIGAEAIVAGAACVIRDVPSRHLAKGVPAISLPLDSD